MMTNAMSYYVGSKGELREAIAAGGVTEVEIPPALLASRKELALRAPDGKIRSLPIHAGKAVVGPLDLCGVWGIVPRPATKPEEVAQAKQPPPAELEVA